MSHWQTLRIYTYKQTEQQASVLFVPYTNLFLLQRFRSPVVPDKKQVSVVLSMSTEVKELCPHQR